VSHGQTEAAAFYASLLKTDSRNFDALRNLGLIRFHEGRYEESASLLARALSRNPQSAGVQSARGRVLMALGRFGEAVQHYRRALALAPASADVLTDMAAAQLSTQDASGAISTFRQAIEVDAQHLAARQGLGDALESVGRRDEAAAVFAQAVVVAPKDALLRRRLAECSRYREDDGGIDELERLLADAVRPVDQVHLHAALAKAYADLDQHDRAFHHVMEGNRIQRGQFNYDEAATLGLLDRIRERFSADFIRAKAGLGHPSSSPIFIVGMPRSGSTLVEQVLASHSKVFGAGEIRNLDTAILGLGSGRFESERFFDDLPGFSRKHLYRVGAAYLASLGDAPASAQRITNKLLGNFLDVGLIHLVLPTARIVHIVRDPVDTCVSRFSKLIVPGQAYSYELAELGRYHRAYEQLMAHWRSVLPPEVMIELSYEAMVADLPGEARRLVEFCGLEWETACLDFHRTERVVTTPSRSQVRQPLYDSAVGRWRRHAEFLQPLLQALERG
jgi:tetratricopeptide (TPR) repeat protein